MANIFCFDCLQPSLRWSFCFEYQLERNSNNSKPKYLIFIRYYSSNWVYGALQQTYELWLFTISNAICALSTISHFSAVVCFLHSNCMIVLDTQRDNHRNRLIFIVTVASLLCATLSILLLIGFFFFSFCLWTLFVIGRRWKASHHGRVESAKYHHRSLVNHQKERVRSNAYSSLVHAICK